MSTPSPVRQFFRSSVSMTVLYAGSTGLSFLSGVVLARLLGAAEYGAYALALTATTLAGLIAEFGLPTLAMRETGRARASGSWATLRGLVRWSDRAIIGSSAMLALLCWVAILVIGRGGSPFLRASVWGMILVPAVAIGKLRSMVLLALDKVFTSQFPMMIVRPGLFVLGCLIAGRVFAHPDASLAMALQTVAAITAAIIVIVQYRRWRPPALTETPPAYPMREWLATCLPMGLSEALRLLQGQLALLVIGVLATTAAAGVYRVADAASQLSIVISSVVATATTPLFARLHGEGQLAELESIALLSAWAMVGGAFAFGLPIVLAGSWLFPHVFGPEFAASLPLFRVLWLGVLGSATGGLSLAIANMTGHHVLATRSFVVIVAANAVIGMCLVPLLGAMGGAIASAIASLAGTAYCAVGLHQRTGINPTIFTRRNAQIVRQAITFAHAWANRA